jgi:hypothetical protein
VDAFSSNWSLGQVIVVTPHPLYPPLSGGSKVVTTVLATGAGRYLGDDGFRRDRGFSEERLLQNFRFSETGDDLYLVVSACAFKGVLEMVESLTNDASRMTRDDVVKNSPASSTAPEHPVEVFGAVDSLRCFQVSFCCSCAFFAFFHLFRCSQYRSQSTDVKF